MSAGATSSATGADAADEAYAALWARLPATADVGWWAAHAAASPDGRVLYLGAGTGRLLLPVAERARSTVAVERRPAVAAVLRERLEAEPELAERVIVVEADVRDLAGGEDAPAPAGWFGRVLLPSSLLNELVDPADRLAVLRAAAHRCAHDGRVVLQVLNPYWLVAGPDVEEGALVPAGGGVPMPVVVHRVEQWAWAQRHRLRIVYTLDPGAPGVPAERATDELDVVALFPRELEQLCRRAGLVVEERWGSMPGETVLDRRGGTWHLVCRRYDG